MSAGSIKSRGIVSWPEEERPRERLLSRGPQALTDAELVAILIRIGFRGTSAVELGRQILNRFGSLRAMVEAPVLALLDIKGLKGAKASQLVAAMEIARRVAVPRDRKQIGWEQYRRGLCLLDPYGLHLDWEVVEAAGQMRTIDLFLNFPVVDMNRNVLWRNPDGVDPADLERMNAFWGDKSWRDVAYTRQPGLFGEMLEKEDNEALAEGFRKRLREVVGFKHVPQPMPMRNRKGATVYYLFFASQKPVAEEIVTDIFNKYRQRGAS